MTVLPERVLLYGVDSPLPESRTLRAGPLAMEFEAGDLRYVRLGSVEIARRIYVAVRDRDWLTVPAELSGVLVVESEAGFRVTYNAHHRRGAIDFEWSAEVEGTPDGTVRFSMRGQALATFLRNRIGFCVLHPIRECAGRPCDVEHADGSNEKTGFPRLISPENPFHEMTGLEYDAAEGVRIEFKFEGDRFETEDQRNWTDASFKTFCTPLSLPYPVEIRRGDRVEKAISVSVRGVPAPPIPVLESEAVDLRLEEISTGMPRIGLGMASHGERLSRRAIVRLRALGLSHVRVDLALSRPETRDRLERAIEVTRALDTSLEAALFVTDGGAGELDVFAALIESVHAPVARFLVFHEREKVTRGRWIEAAREKLGRVVTAPIGGGTNVEFVDLNRQRPDPSGLDVVAYSINPQVHAFDNASLVETLEAQGATVETAREFLGAVPLAVGPVTLRRRFNPDATGPVPEPNPGEPPAPVDPRQMSLFGAVWTLGTLKCLSEAGIESVTLYETTGWRGVMETEGGSSLPERFRSVPGGVYPLYYVLADAAEFAGGRVRRVSSSAPRAAVGWALERDGRRRVVAANLSPVPRRVRIAPASGPARVARLDASNAVEAMAAPEVFRSGTGEPLNPLDGAYLLDLPPYGLARLAVST